MKSYEDSAVKARASLSIVNIGQGGIKGLFGAAPGTAGASGGAVGANAGLFAGMGPLGWTMLGLSLLGGLGAFKKHTFFGKIFGGR